jgi:ribosome biogenesis protein MAK21
LTSSQGENVLLTSLVNKLGDPDRKISSKVCLGFASQTFVLELNLVWLPAQVVFLLAELIRKHPGMKMVVTKVTSDSGLEHEFVSGADSCPLRAIAPALQEIEQLLFRHNVSERAKYYAVIWLNQIIFTARWGLHPTFDTSRARCRLAVGRPPLAVA